MRSPVDVETTPAERALERPPNGKAFERLREFEEARGLDDATARTTNGDAALTYEVAAELADAERAVGRPWRPLGPTVMRGGQTYGSGAGSRVDVSGRVSAIAVDPAGGQHILLGSAAGGVWETRDGGATWTPRGDALTTLAVGALCFDPHAPTTVYLGSGEGDAYSRLGQGVFRSTDGGATWTLLAGSPFVGAGFHRLVVDPADSSRIYAATTGGLYTSSDAGATWTQRRGGRCWSVSVHPSGGATEVLAGCADGLFRSVDSGATWTAVTLGGVPAPPGFRRLAVGHAPSDGGVAWAWAATDPLMALSPTQNQPTPRLWRRATATGAFTAIAVDASVRTGQAWYDWHVHPAPNSTTTVYLGEINLFRVDRTGRTWSWTNLSSKTAGDSIHPDQHSMAFDPVNGDVIYAGCDGGVFRSPNQGTNWVDLNDGLAITEIEYLAQDVGASRWLLAGTQDNGSVRWVGDPAWDHVADGDGGDCASSTTDPTHVYHSYFYMGLDRSTDRGNTWTWTPTANRDPKVYAQLFYPPMEASGDVVAQAGESVFVSRNGGAAFTETALPGRPTASAMVMPGPDRILVGTTGGQVFRLSWSGTSWGTPTTLTSPRAAWISDLHTTTANPDRIWATSSQLGGGRVFRSDDGGTTWTDRSAGLPALPINAIEVHPSDANRVWVAADMGVYESTDGGLNWSNVSVGLPNCIVADLVYHRHARVLRAGTRSRGVWELVIDEVTDPTCRTQWTGSLAPNESRRWFTFGWPASWHMVWTVMPTTVAPGAPQLGWDVQIERADAEFVTYWITVTNRTAAPVTFEGRYAILSYR